MAIEQVVLKAAIMSALDDTKLEPLLSSMDFISFDETEKKIAVFSVLLFVAKFYSV